MSILSAIKKIASLMSSTQKKSKYIELNGNVYLNVKSTKIKLQELWFFWQSASVLLVENIRKVEISTD